MRPPFTFSYAGTARWFTSLHIFVPRWRTCWRYKVPSSAWFFPAPPQSHFHEINIPAFSQWDPDRLAYGAVITPQIWSTFSIRYIPVWTNGNFLHAWSAVAISQYSKRPKNSWPLQNVIWRRETSRRTFVYRPILSYTAACVFKLIRDQTSLTMLHQWIHLEFPSSAQEKSQKWNSKDLKNDCDYYVLNYLGKRNEVLGYRLCNFYISSVGKIRCLNSCSILYFYTSLLMSDVLAGVCIVISGAVQTYLEATNKYHLIPNQQYWIFYIVVSSSATIISCKNQSRISAHKQWRLLSPSRHKLCDQRIPASNYSCQLATLQRQSNEEYIKKIKS
jgi:hypothetical protein